MSSSAVDKRSYVKFYPAATSEANPSRSNAFFYYYIKTGDMDLDKTFLALIVTFHLLTMLCYLEVFINPSETRLYTVIFAVLLIFVTSPGVSVGAHRLWTHRAFKGMIDSIFFKPNKTD